MPNARSFVVYMARYYAKNGYKETGKNHQQFSDIVNAYGLKGYQDQPWCATYQFALELMAFGKDDALKHWNMTAKDYCGYSCFDTEKKFAAAKKTGTTPKVGALVIFKQSHMGRVISNSPSKKTFECAEGNSGDKCVVKTYSYADPSIKSFCYINYGNDSLTEDKIVGAVKATYEMAHNLGWVYSDSHTIPPCVPDKRISCDRLEALACFILGYTNQPPGGFVTSSMEHYLTSWGWTVLRNVEDLRRGDFILFKRKDEATVTARGHAFTLMYYNSASDIGKYDTGENWRIKSKQPFEHVSFDEWPERSFYCGFRAPYAAGKTYVIESAVNRDFCIDADKNTTNIQLWKNYGNAQQKFKIEAVSGDYYKIICSNGKVLDVRGGKAVNRQNIQQYTWNGTKAQLWKQKKNEDGSVTFLSAIDNTFVIDLSGANASNGRNIQLYKSNGTAAQKWFIK